ncbi:MAG: SIR2 family protein [Saprospiraceae bacterium]|nr:SIR2 family protein [Saprospiraceae bacterium]
MIELPKPLLDSIIAQKAVLFLGAGASWGAKNPQGKTIPVGNQLRDIISDNFLNGKLKDRSLAEITEYAINETDLLTVQRFIRDFFLAFEPEPYHKIIPLFPWRAIFTTNIDLIIEKSYNAVSGSVQTPVTVYKNAQKFDQEVRAVSKGLEYIKLHGCINHFEELNVPFILATEQYAKFSASRTRLFSRLTDLAEEYNIIFAGYSVLDPHIQAILHGKFDLGSIRPTYYMIRPTFDDVEERYWQSKRVIPIKVSFSDFLEEIQKKIDPTLAQAGFNITGSDHPITRFYNRNNITETADLLNFLERDFTYIYSGMSTAAQTAHEFYKGYDVGFFPIISKMDVRRNITDSILSEVFLANDPTPSTNLYLIKAAAGAGKSILLKRLAWEAATDFDCLVLYHKPSGSLRLSAIEELYSYTGKRIFIFVDRAAYYVDEISKLYDDCKQKNLPITIITAERDNEWGIRCEKLDQKTDIAFDVHKFAHNEIENLLRKLEEFKALGHLERIAPNSRLQELEKRLDRQILVILYEATQGIPFEKLIIDEYERIIPTEAQLLYLDICCLNRINVPVRAGLISRISNIHFSEFHARFLEPLKQIVRVEKDEYIGDMMYSSRHATIAQLVFENILKDQEKRFDVLTRIISEMNLSYSSDDVAFRAMATGREIAELFPSQDLGRQFFEVAIKASGNDAAILQQRAIFEISHAGGNAEIGLTWIEKAESLRPQDRSIRHTKGNILRACANSSRNSLRRDKFRTDAIRTLTSLLGTDAKQSHGFHTYSLILLDGIRDYLSENTDTKNNEDRILNEKLEELQKALSNGLSLFPEEARLLAAEAEYFKLLQDNQRALQSLELAFRRNKRLDWIAVKLSKIYREKGDSAKSIAILKEAIDVNTSSKEANFALGKMLTYSSSISERQQATEYLRRGFTKGDSNFTEQLWYARELFLNERFDEAKAIFSELEKLRIASDIKRRIIGIIGSTEGGAIIFKGTIIKKEEGYLFVNFSGHKKDIFVPRSEVQYTDWQEVKVGNNVQGKVGFTYRGPCGTDVKLT